MRRGNPVDRYYDPEAFSKELAKHTSANIFTGLYPQNTRFFINNYFKSNADAFVLIKALHEAGFSKLCLLTGQVFKQGELPEYLAAILKSDIDKIMKCVSE